MQVKKVPNFSARPAAWLWLLVALLVAVSYFVAVAGTHGGDLVTAWTLATTHEPERYTALYFSNPAQLPSFARASTKQTVPFHIVNHEGAAKTYRYRIRFQVEGKAMDQYFSVTIADGQDMQQAAVFTIPKPNEASTLTIQLLNTSQQLTLRSNS